jgi:hypothetical protein
MPTYSFIDTDTEDEFDIFMSWSDREEFLKENPSIQPTLTSAPALVRGTNSNSKVPEGFKEVLSRVAEAHPESAVGDRYGKKTIKNVKTKEIVQRYYDKSKKR